MCFHAIYLVENDNPILIRGSKSQIKIRLVGRGDTRQRA